MARDFLVIGSSPPGEKCVQIGCEDYRRLAKAECLRYVDTLRATVGPEPEGAELRVKWFAHDFGEYCEVVCFYSEDDEAATEYALKCESDGPDKWPAERGVQCVEVS